ncbi:MAG: VWA domain-containing protein [bacterium]|nr:VWA domain-containing protein [bacterium]
MNTNPTQLNHTTSGRWRRVRQAVALALTAATLLVAAGPTPVSAAGLLIADGGFGGVLEIESHEVTVTVNNGVAVTEVKQVFRNTEDRQVEALYTFPVPKGASVANFSMWINGKEMIGEVLEKQRAREIYESYKKTRVDPGLLEQKDYKTFEMRIFPIGPKAKQIVKIRYYQEVESDNDWITYVYPLSTVSGGGKNSKTTGKFALSLHAKSEIPITKMESPSHNKQFVIAKHADSYYQAGLETTGGDLNRDVVIAYKIARPKTGIDVIYSKTGSQDGYFCMTLTAGKQLVEMDTGMDYVFLLDISGSMADEGKLKISRNCIKAFVDELGDKDRFEIITFNVTPTTLFNKLTAVDAKSRASATAFLLGRSASGGTVLAPALRTAYKYRDEDRPLNVLVLSDGMTQQSERTQLLAAIGRRPSNARVFCVGVGNEVNRPLLGRLAREAGGLAAFLSRGDNFVRQAKAFRRKLTKPAMREVKINFEGGDVYDLYPSKLPNLYHGAPVRLYGRYRKSGKSTIKLIAEVNGQEVPMVSAVDLPKNDSDNPEIQRMWAWQKLRELTQQPKPLGQNVVEEIVRLGEGYSIVSEYTSFIVLENDAEYKRWQIDRRNALLVARDRDARKRLEKRLEGMRDESLAALGPQDAQAKADSSPKVTQNTPVSSPRSRNPFGGGGGGGPVGPISLTVIAALAIGARRRRKKTGNLPDDSSDGDQSPTTPVV